MITEERSSRSAMAVEYYMVERYGERAEPSALSNADLAAELHELVNELPELSGLVGDAVRSDPARDVAGNEAVALRRQLGAAQVRAASVWDEFVRRFGARRARFLQAR